MAEPGEGKGSARGRAACNRATHGGRSTYQGWHWRIREDSAPRSAASDTFCSPVGQAAPRPRMSSSACTRSRTHARTPPRIKPSGSISSLLVPSPPEAAPVPSGRGEANKPPSLESPSCHSICSAAEGQLGLGENVMLLTGAKVVKPYNCSTMRREKSRQLSSAGSEPCNSLALASAAQSRFAPPGRSSSCCGAATEFLRRGSLAMEVGRGGARPLPVERSWSWGGCAPERGS